MDRKKIAILSLYVILFLICFGIVQILDVLLGGNKSSDITDAVQTITEEVTEEESCETNEAESVIEEETHSAEETEVIAEKHALIPAEETEKEYIPPDIIIASDTHYYSSKLTDYGESFNTMQEQDDGKLTRYAPEIIDAFLEEVIMEHPDALILSGDLALNGERTGHQELSSKLKRVKEAGIEVLVIPGNHDINHPWSASYVGDKREEAPTVDADGFFEIYHEFGYDQAIYRDENSLSYIYGLDEKNWLMMLDFCQYEPVNKVTGYVKEETADWIDKVLCEALDSGIQVIPVGHHNLLEESRLYTIECVIENNDRLIDVFEKYKIPVYVSGHLHLQRIKKHKQEPSVSDDTYGITEIVNGSLMMPPCQYGRMKWQPDGSIKYSTQFTDLEGWAERMRSSDENLLNFKEYGNSFVMEILSSQIAKKIKNLSQQQTDKMSLFYTELMGKYCMGLSVNGYEVRKQKEYTLWERNLPESRLFKELDSIIKDMSNSHNQLEFSFDEWNEIRYYNKVTGLEE